MKTVIYRPNAIIENDYVWRIESWVSWVLLFGNDVCVYNEGAIFLAREVRRGRGVTVLSRDKTEVSRWGGRRNAGNKSQISWKNDFDRS